MTDTGMYHDGSRQLQDRFGSRPLADRLVEVVVHRELTDADRAFIESRPMFFLATADSEGRPDCSYKGGRPGFVRVVDAATLAFPSYDGNGMFKSLGNVLVNPHVGLLFVDFESPRRLRVNGRAQVSDERSAPGRARRRPACRARGGRCGLSQLPALHPQDGAGRGVALRAVRGAHAAGAGVEDAPDVPRGAAARRLGGDAVAMARELGSRGRTGAVTRFGVAVFALAFLVASGCAGRPADTSRDTAPFSVVETGIPELQKALSDWPRHLAPARRPLPRADRHLRGPAQGRDHGEPARARRGRRARPRARPRPGPRPASRHPDRPQGQHPHGGHADHRRRRRLRGIPPGLRGHGDPEPARGRRPHHRQDRAHRAGQLGGRRAHADARQLQRARRIRLQPVRPAARSPRRQQRRPRRPGHRRDRARASAPRRACGRRTSAPRRRARS